MHDSRCRIRTCGTSNLRNYTQDSLSTPEQAAVWPSTPQKTWGMGYPPPPTPPHPPPPPPPPNLYHCRLNLCNLCGDSSYCDFYVDSSKVDSSYGYSSYGDSSHGDSFHGDSSHGDSSYGDSSYVHFNVDSSYGHWFIGAFAGHLPVVRRGVSLRGWLWGPLGGIPSLVWRGIQWEVWSEVGSCEVGLSRQRLTVVGLAY